jgi:ribokinase
MWFRNKSYEVICIGSVSKDIFFPTDEGIVLETPEDITAKQKVAFELGGKYRVKDRFEAVGGVAANVATGLARLGRSVATYGCVGGDEIGRYIMNELAKEHVATDLLQRHDDAKTDLSAIIVLTQSGERTIFHNRDANERLHIEKKMLTDTQWVFVSALNGDWKKNLATVLSAQKQYGFSLAYNPGQHNIKDDAQQIFNTLPFVDVLLLNKDEAIELLLQSAVRPTDEELDDERFLVEKLVSAGAKMIGMSDGKRGSWGYDGESYWYCPIHTRSNVVDSTGAGDAFGSGFLAAHLMGRSLSESLQYGMANSGSVVGFYGAVEGLLTQSETDALIKDIVPKSLL